MNDEIFYADYFHFAIGKYVDSGTGLPDKILKALRNTCRLGLRKEKRILKFGLLTRLQDIAGEKLLFGEGEGISPKIGIGSKRKPTF